MQYEIKGTPFPAVICHLQDGEQMITEGGGMSWMTPNMVMETTTNGGLGKSFRQALFRRQNVPKQVHLPWRRRYDFIYKLLPRQHPCR